MIIGIDLGTTYSAMAYISKDNRPEIIPNAEGARTTPSAVMFEDDGNVVVGEIAKDSAIVEGARVVEYIKNEMGNPRFKFCIGKDIEYSPEEISAFILKKLKRDAESYLGTEVKQAVITVPAYFTDAQRKATQDAGVLAGLEVLKIINEPTAAAIAYAHLNDMKDCNILVYDLGGGTFDVTIMRYSEKEITVKATGGLRRLGGHFFDQEIVNLVADYLQERGIDIYDDDHIDLLQELNRKAEECKIHLSTRNETYISVNCGKIKERIKITREQFNKLIKNLYERTERVVLDTLKDAGMTWKDIDKVLLVGGSSRIPYIRERLRELSGKEPSCEINLDEAVAIGAAIQASMLVKDEAGKKISEMRIVDVCSHSIGLITVDARAMKRVNSIIIERNTQIPVRRSRKFFTSENDQEWIKLEVTEGEGTDIEDVNIFGTFEIDLPRGLPRGSEVMIDMAIDENQIVHIYTRLSAVRDYFREIEIDRNSNLNKHQMEKKKDLISKIVVA